jgi:hypothetical protein
MVMKLGDVGQMINFAICTDIPGFDNDGVFNPKWIDMHPGSEWLTHFRRLGLEENAFRCASGDLALARVRTGDWIASDTFVIDEMGSRASRDLIANGCIPFLQTAFESPLYAPLFYDGDMPSRFRYATRYVPKNEQTSSTLSQHFPSFGRSILTSDTGKRMNRIVCVAGNKYRSPDFDFSLVTSRVTLVRWIKHNIGKIVSTSYRNALFASLHNSRLKILNELARADVLDLYGSGWNNELLVPKAYRDVFRGISSSWKGIAGSKQELIQRYDFGLCIENTEQPGYITEKIFNCLAAGVIPVYLGAPDIADFVPSETYVDLRVLMKDGVNLPSYLTEMPSVERERLRFAGHVFLSSSVGDKYSYEGYSEWVADLALALR